MGGVSFDGVDEIRNEIVAAFELHIDLRPRVAHLLSARDETVVNGNPDHQKEDREDDKSAGKNKEEEGC